MVGDHRANGLVERSIQTIKRKLGTEKHDPNFNNFKSTIQQTVEDIRKSKNAVLKNHHLKCILVENQIPSGTKCLMMLLNMLLQLKDLNVISSLRIRSPVRITVGIVPSYSREEVLALPSPIVSNRCLLRNEVSQIVNHTRLWQTSRGPPMSGHSLNGTFRPRVASWCLKNWLAVTQIWLIPLKLVLPEIPSGSMITRPARHPLHFLTVRFCPLRVFQKKFFQYTCFGRSTNIFAAQNVGQPTKTSKLEKLILENPKRANVYRLSESRRLAIWQTFF